MIATDIDVLVDDTNAVLWPSKGMNGSFGVQSPGVEVGLNIVDIATHIVISGHDAGDHIVKSPFWNGTIEDGNS